jgi:predicted permease
MMWDDRAISDSAKRWFRIWGRLQPGVPPDQARAVLQTVFTSFRREQAAMLFGDGPRDRKQRFIQTSLYLRSAANGPSGLRREFEPALWVLASVAALVLLIACANVAGLLIARAAARDREIALRISIGAGRGRLVQQMLIESALLSIASCALGTLLAAAAAPRIVSLLSTSHSVVRLDLQLDWRLLAFLACVAALVTCLFGFAPALRASAVSPNDALKSGGKHTVRIGLFRPLVAAQTAFSFVVLFVAGLCLSSFAQLVKTDVGFDRNNVVIVEMEAKELRDGGAKALVVWEQLLARLREHPAIQSAGLSGWGLFEGRGRNKSIRVPGREVDGYDPWYLPVSPGFFDTMGIRLVDGRDLEWRDVEPESPTAVIVNKSFARRYFPGESPLGKRFFLRATRVDPTNALRHE